MTVTLGAVSQVVGDGSGGTDTIGVVDQIVGSNFNDVFVVGSDLRGSNFSRYATGDFVVLEGGVGIDTFTGKNATRISYLNATGGVSLREPHSAAA